MKRYLTTILTALAATLAGATVSAQDLLVLRDGTSVRIKTLEINKKRIKYVRFGTEAPVYTRAVSEIDYIEYPDGDRDTFGRKPAAAAAAPGTTARTAATAATTGESAPANLYQPGDIYSEAGITGIVIATTDNGEHGTLASLDEACLEWSSLPRREARATGAGNAYDGRENMEAVARFIAGNALSWSDFPAFDWCRSKGDGWYLPALNEVWMMGTTYNGGSRNIPNKNIRKKFNEALKSNGGKQVNNIMFYLSSTESDDARSATYSHMNTDKPYTGETAKTDKLYIRAFHRF